MRIPVAASLRVAGTTPYYGANGIQDYVEGYTHDGEFILVAEDGAIDLKNYPVKCVKGRIWVNNHAHVLQGKCACVDNQFLAYAISQADIESLLVGGGRAKLNAATLMDIELLLPSKDEQIQIGHYLARLDRLITLHQRECDKLTQLKKSMLDKLFPKPGERFPEIRFAGFTDPWEQRKFSDMVELRRGLTYSPTDIVEYGNGVRVLRSSNIIDDQFTLHQDDVFVRESVVNIDFATNGDILITAANGSTRLVGKRGKIASLPGKTVHGGFMLLGSTSDPDFIYASMGSNWYRRFLNIGVSGGNGAIGNLDKDALADSEIMVPSAAERRAIGSYFSQLDNLITLHQRKLELLRNTKKSLLDRMFV